jgi:hypothetical protein
VEQESLYRQLVAAAPSKFDLNTTDTERWRLNPTLLQLAQTRIKIFECPSDDPYTSTIGTFFGIHTGGNDMTAGLLDNDRGGDVLGRTNYVGNAGCFGLTTVDPYGRYYGPLTNRSKTTLLNITDGTSNTILFGEALGGSSTGTRDSSIAWMGSGSFCTAWGTTAGTSQWYQLSSKHDGVIQLCYADGSVRSLRKGVGQTFLTDDWYQLQRAAGMQDGEVIDFDSIGN